MPFIGGSSIFYVCPLFCDVSLVCFCHAGHRCKTPGCGNVLVLDGNQKNNRQVCAAEEAGFVECMNLPGKVKTGCMETLEQKSLFCSLHKPREVKVEANNSTKHMVVESILRKKETRNATFYEVCAIMVYGQSQ